MAFRNLERKPWRAFVTILGIAMATGISIVPGALREGIEHLTDLQWTQMQRQDVTISLTEPASEAAFVTFAEWLRWSRRNHFETFRSASTLGIAVGPFR
jgi:putative ABC transport system permease protein